MKLSKYLVILLFVGCLVFGFALVFGSYYGYELAKDIIDSYSYDGDVSHFTLDYYESFAVRLRITGFIILLLGCVVLASKRLLQQKASLLRGAFIVNLKAANGIIFPAQLPRSYWYALFLIMVCAIGVRCVYINQPIRADEARTFSAYASRPLPILLSDWTAPNNQVFHTLLVHIGYSIFGNHEWSIRLPSLLFGIFLIPSVFIWGNLLFKRGVGIIAAAIFAGCGPVIEFSCMARGYTIVTMAFVWLGICCAGIRKQPNNVVLWLGVVLCSALGAYTIPIMLYPYATMMCWLFFTSLFSDMEGIKSSELFRRIVFVSLAVLLLTLVFYLPVLLGTDLSLILDEKEAFKGRPWGDFLQILSLAMCALWKWCIRDLPHSMIWTFLVSFVLGIVFYRRIARVRISVFLCMLFISCGLLLIQRIVPYPRVWLFSFPLFALTISGGMIFLVDLLPEMMLLRRDGLVVVLSIVVCVVVNTGVLRAHPTRMFSGGDSFSEAESVAVFLVSKIREEDLVVALSPSPGPLIYYFNKYRILNRVWDLLEYQPTSFDLGDSGRIYLVVNYEQKQTCDQLLKQLAVVDELGLKVDDCMENRGASIYLLTHQKRVR